MKDNKNEEIISYIKFYSEIKKVILTPTYEELKKKLCNVMQIKPELFNSLKLSYKDEDNDIITVETDEDYNILLEQIKGKEVEILNIEIEEDASIDINECSKSIIKFHESMGDDEQKEEKKNKNDNLNIISNQQFEINKEENKNNQKDNNKIESIESNRITIIEDNNNNQVNKNNLNIENNISGHNNIELQYKQNDINDNLIQNNINNFNNNNINNDFINNHINNNINNNFNNNFNNNINNNNLNNNINKFLNNNINNINENSIVNNQTFMVFPYNCNLCNKYPIAKVLYYCLVCGIPLCDECEDKLGINHRHSILKVQTNEQYDDLNLKIKQFSKEKIIPKNNNNNSNEESGNENQSQIFKIYNNLKDSILGGFFGDNKNNERNNINPKVNNNQQAIPQQMSLIQLARAQYDLNGISDNKLQEALEKTKGNIDDAIALLLN